MYGINLCNPSLELNQADKLPCADEPDYSTPASRAAIAVLDRFIASELKREMLEKDRYVEIHPKYIPRVEMLKSFKDHTSALESRLRNAESFGTRQVEAIVNRYKGEVA